MHLNPDQAQESGENPENEPVEIAWDREINRRVADLRSGRVEPLDGDVVELEMRQFISSLGTKGG